jgi:hypothetical protein
MMSRTRTRTAARFGSGRKVVVSPAFDETTVG